MVKEVVTDYEALSHRSPEYEVVKNFNSGIRDIIVDMKATIRENNFTYLTAPQIGKYVRIVCINFNGDIRTFVNPMISAVKGFGPVRERCNSIPDKEYIRFRYADIQVTYQTPLGQIETKQLVGAAAILMQHAIEHLEGVLLCDIGLEVDDDFDNASEEEQMEVIKAYADSLDIQEKTLKEEIMADKELSQLNDAIDFMTEVNEGKVQLETYTIPKQEDASEEGTNR